MRTYAVALTFPAKGVAPSDSKMIGAGATATFVANFTPELNVLLFELRIMPFTLIWTSASSGMPNVRM
jgi:hypothetical protein